MQKRVELVRGRFRSPLFHTSSHPQTSLSFFPQEREREREREIVDVNCFPRKHAPRGALHALNHKTKKYKTIKGGMKQEHTKIQLVRASDRERGREGERGTYTHSALYVFLQLCMSSRLLCLSEDTVLGKKGMNLVELHV